MMTNDLRMNGNRISGLSESPTNKYEATNKEYVDNAINKAQINPSHTPENILKYIMDDIDETSSEYGIEIDKIDNFEESFHSYNKRVIYLKLIKDENDYEGRIGYNIFKLIDKSKDRYYTAVIEWLTTDNNVWDKMEIFNNITSGSIISNQTKKFEDGNGLYYTRSIIQIKVMKISTAPIYLLSTIHIENVNSTYPKKFHEVYNIIYGVSGSNTSIQANVYDYHEAYKIDKTKIKMLVDLDMNGYSILNSKNFYSIMSGLVNQYKSFVHSSMRIETINITIYEVYLYSTESYSGASDKITFNARGLETSKSLLFVYSKSPGITKITTLLHFNHLSSIRLDNGKNMPYKLTYRLN